VVSFFAREASDDFNLDSIRQTAVALLVNAHDGIAPHLAVFFGFRTELSEFVIVGGDFPRHKTVAAGFALAAGRGTFHRNPVFGTQSGKIVSTVSDFTF